jgi:TolB protein
MWQVMVMNADGSALRPLTHEGENQMPVWSPDGRRIAFMSMRAMEVGGQRLAQIYMMNADGSNQMNVTRSAFNSYSPSWSSRGQIYFSQQLAPGTMELHLTSSDGTGTRRLTDLGGIIMSTHAR